MATSQKLLLEASGSLKIGFSAKIEEFLKATEKCHVGSEEARLYHRFMQKCLHTFMNKMKGDLSDGVQVEEILKSSIICGGAYRHLQHCLDADKTHAVPLLLFNVIFGIKDRVHVYAKYMIMLSEVALEIFDDIGCPESAHKILSSYYGCLWNISLNRGCLLSLKDVLIFRKMSLQFLCCVPLENNDILHFLQLTVIAYQQYDRTLIDKVTSDSFLSIFQCVISRLNKLSLLQDTSTKSKYRTLLLQIQIVYVGYFVKVSEYRQARAIIHSLAVSYEKYPFLSSVLDIYSYTISASEASKQSQSRDISSEKLKHTNNTLKQCIPSESRENIKLIIRALSLLIQTLIPKAQVDNLETSLVKELTVSCTHLEALCLKFMLECQKLEKTSDERKQKELSAERQDLMVGGLSIYNRHLLLLHRLFEEDPGIKIFPECLDVTTKFRIFLEDHCSVLTEKSQQSNKSYIGYVCNLIGYKFMQAGYYDEAVSLFTILVDYLYKSQETYLPKLFEKLVTCFAQQDKWMEATGTIVKALTRLTSLEDGLEHTVNIWTRFKKESSSKDEIFKSMTLNTVLKNSGVKLEGLSSRQLLLAEYEAFKLYMRRQYEMEYHVLCELYECSGQKPVQQAEAMVALAATMCVTRDTYKHMSASELLNKAMITLDKNLPGCESSLAVACYVKYAVIHEEAIEVNMKKIENSDGEAEYFKAGDISENFRFTLQHEQDNLPFLVRAIDMWEKFAARKGQKLPKGREKLTTKKTSGNEESVFGLEHHVDNLILCGTRLTAMKQPQLALRALQLAKDLLLHLDSKQKPDLALQLTRALMLLGRYEEAESVIDNTGEDRKQTSVSYLSLLMSELYMLVGKKDTSLEILQSILDSTELIEKKTQKNYLIHGTAKRLLSMALCLPDDDHMTRSANQYLLSLAFDAVHCHITVITFLTHNKDLDRNADKWLVLNEMLSSLLHHCQLCRLVGLTREGFCYLTAGLNISQCQGLPRWSCEFLIEMLRVQSMEADFAKGLCTAESLNCILNSENQSTDMSQNQSANASKTKKSLESKSDKNENFGFQISPSVPPINTTEKTPERVYVAKELDNEKKNKLKQLKAPTCVCASADCDQCPDIVRHKLCMKAGIVLADFLAQMDTRSTADRLLTEVQSNFKILNGLNGSLFPGEMGLVKKGHIKDPHLLYTCLEAGCIKAESYLHQKDFHKVHQLWKTFQSLEKSGSLKNVLHSNILLTRLALCDASGYMLSLHENMNKAQTNLYQSEIGSSVDPADMDKQIEDQTEKLERLSINPRRKVSFEGEDNTFSVTGTCMKIARKVTKFTGDMMTPIKQVVLDAVNTPNLQFVPKKSKLVLTTPSNRMNVLEQLMASDEDDDITFPDPKPVTPRVAPKSSKSSRIKRNCKTEPRNATRKKMAFKIAEDPVDEESKVACTLNFLPQSNDEKSASNTVDNPCVEQIKIRPKKQGKKEKCNSTSSFSGTEGHTSISEHVDNKEKGKPRFTKKSRRKPVADKTKSVESSSCKLDSDENMNDGNGTNVLKEDCDNAYLKQESSCLDQVKDDVYVFGLEASPDVAKKKSNSTSSFSGPEGHTSISEHVDNKDTKGKPRVTKKSGRKPVADKTKSVKKSVESSSSKIDSDENMNNGNGTNVLKEKCTDSDNANLKKSSSCLDQIKDDVYVFGLEASPDVAKVAKPKRGKQTKGTQRAKKANGVLRKQSNDEDQKLEKVVENKENESLTTATRSSRRVRVKKETDNTEVVRKNSEELDDDKLEISLDELILDSDSHSDNHDQKNTEASVDINVQESMKENEELMGKQLNDIEVEIEPIEIRRGRTDTKSNTSMKSRRCGKVATNNGDSSERVLKTTVSKTEEGSSSGEDCHNTSRSMEQMRSGRLTSMNELTHVDLVDEIRVSCEEMKFSDVSPSGADIISTLEELYERLCLFPPNPQHSDVCHMLALHHLSTDPRRAASLLSDAMAVSFRHQVMLNRGKKARKEAKAGTSSDRKTVMIQDSNLFTRDNLQLSDMIKSVPEDWCVVQLSVVSVGLPQKQMILTRFVKDEDPVILKLPGFSSPQGCRILEDFSAILEQGAESAKIETAAEWWSARGKLDTDMKNWVERIEKYWLGCWRCAVLPGEFPAKILDLACKDLNKIAKKDVKKHDTELLLLAHKVVRDEELGQCITDILGVHRSDISTIVSVLKKYSNMNTDKKDQQHTVLILDKTVQHLPWESFPVLSDRSVSRMPCLSHLVTQLNNLKAQESSVFVKGVDLKNTFYILNPESDLPRTQNFFKEWFESEKDWTGVIGCRPSSEQFIDALTKKDFLLFCGHGSGGRMFSGDEIEKLKAQAVTMLMGCSSGRLLVKGQLEPSGIMNSYFLAGCPTMVANLWDVTDKDIDKFTENLIKTWMSSPHGTYLTNVVQKSRAVCKLRYLNGIAPVVYGLPVFINNGNK